MGINMNFTTILIIIGQFIKSNVPTIVYWKRNKFLEKKEKKKKENRKKFEYYARNYHFFHAQ